MVNGKLKSLDVQIALIETQLGITPNIQWCADAVKNPKFKKKISIDKSVPDLQQELNELRVLKAKQKLFWVKNEIGRSLKKAKAFLVQKTVRKMKTADPGSRDSLEKELAIFKSIKHSQEAEAVYENFIINNENEYIRDKFKQFNFENARSLSSTPNARLLDQKLFHERATDEETTVNCSDNESLPEDQEQSCFIESLRASKKFKNTSGRDEEQSQVASKKKNRMGQKARRALAEVQYGDKAKHITSRKGSQKEPARVSIAKNEEKDILHPSWHAKQQSKMREQSAVFQGSKKTFESSSDYCFIEETTIRLKRGVMIKESIIFQNGANCVENREQMITSGLHVQQVPHSPSSSESTQSILDLFAAENDGSSKSKFNIAKQCKPSAATPAVSSNVVDERHRQLEDTTLQSNSSKFGTKSKTASMHQPFSSHANKSPVRAAFRLVNARDSKDRPCQLKFRYMDIIGNGTFGIVCKARDVNTGELLAIKTVYQDHNHQCQVEFLSLVLEYVTLSLDKLGNIFLEGQRRTIMRHFLQAVQYLHSEGICHRDIKPHNLLVDPVTNMIKLCDFGCSKRLTKGEPNIQYICARYYRAPEIALGWTHYGIEADIWSVGCVMGELYSRHPLFTGRNSMDQLAQIFKILGSPNVQELEAMGQDPRRFKAGRSTYSCEMRRQGIRNVLGDSAPDDAINLIVDMLQYDPTKRVTASQALSHPYFQ